MSKRFHARMAPDVPADEARSRKASTMTTLAPTATEVAAVTRHVDILDPRGEQQERIGGASPRLESLEGKTVGIVIDGPWRSWYVSSEILEECLQDRGIDVIRVDVNHVDLSTKGLNLANVRKGSNRDESAMEQLATEVDAAIVGLAN